jgi:dihydroorotate dehydrogenase
MYKTIIRPLLFLLSAETIHKLVATSGELVSHTPVIGDCLRAYFTVNDPVLRTKVAGISFSNPIGLSAGFDKNGEYLSFAEMFGFGFLEVGSITGFPYAGNVRPHARRLVKNESMVINYGLKSEGAEVIAGRLEKKRSRIPFGISAAKTNLPEFINEKAVGDYLYVYKRFQSIGSYDTLNISCPNTYDGTPFTDPKKLKNLLQGVQEIKRSMNITKPTFLKINPDLPLQSIDDILDLISEYHVDGIIIGNLLKERSSYVKRLRFPNEYNQTWPGGLSGVPTREVSTDIIRYVRKRMGQTLIIIGCGGVFSGDDAYEKIQAGASLVQLITGFIFNGPGAIRSINKRLATLLKRDGFSSVADAVGTK